MYAVIKTGGKQFKVAAGHLISVEKLAGEAGDSIAFDEVLLVGGDKETVIGSPTVAGAAVAGEIVGQERTAKILVFKKRRRKNSKRSRGHRQEQTIVRITEILTDGKKATAKTAAAKKTEASTKTAAAADAPEAEAVTAKTETKPAAEAKPAAEDKPTAEAKPAEPKPASTKAKAPAAKKAAAKTTTPSASKKVAASASDDGEKAKPARKSSAKTDEKK